MKRAEKISPTVLKLVARSLKVDGVHGSSGVAIIASALRAEVPSVFYDGHTDKEVILTYFNSLGLDPTPPKQKPGYAKKAAQRRARETAPRITPRRDFSTDWIVWTPSDHPPWDPALENKSPP